jgi:hypothetical protein
MVYVDLSCLCPPNKVRECFLGGGIHWERGVTFNDRKITVMAIRETYSQ